MIILTVVFRADLANLLYQAVSLKKYWQGKKQWMIVIEDYLETENYCRQRIVPIMEGWDIHIVTKYMANSGSGWYRQQSLKLLASADQDIDDHILILDGKNFLVRSASESDFIEKDEFFVQTHHPDYKSEDWKKCCDFFQVTNKTRGYNTTPWLWRKDLVIDTIDEFKKRGVDIAAGDHPPVIEFEAYWIVNQDKIKWRRVDLCEGVYADGIEEKVMLERLHWIKTCNKPFWAFHRYHWNDPILSKISNDFLKERQVVDDLLITEWYYTSKFQACIWTNKMCVC